MQSGCAEFASLNVCNTFFYKSVPRPARDRGTFPLPRRSQDQPSPVAMPKRRAEPSPSGDRRPGNAASPKHPTTVASGAPAGAPCSDDLRARAIEHLSAEENAEARKIFEEILQREPNDPESLLGMALLHAGDGNSEATLKCCERVLALQPMCPEAYCLMALVHEGLAEDETAQRELEKAIYLDSAFAIAHFRLASLHDRKGRRDAAMRGFSNTLKALPDDDRQRVRVYSGGFSPETIARICRQRLGIEPATVPDLNVSGLASHPLVAEDVPK
jgi:tetratricopeptide (TPR) repeat protein